MDVTLQEVRIEDLLAHFLKGALGLELEASIPMTGGAVVPESQTCAAWLTDRGIARICGSYDTGHSHRIRAHVLWLAWWLPLDTHHQGWWRCDRIRFNEWTKGRGF